MVVAVGNVVGRSVDEGPVEELFVIYVSVERVVLGTVDLERASVESFLALENALVVFGILDFCLVERGYSKSPHSCTQKSVGHSVDRRREGARGCPVPGFRAYYQYIHNPDRYTNKCLQNIIKIYLLKLISATLISYFILQRVFFYIIVTLFVNFLPRKEDL